MTKMQNSFQTRILQKDYNKKLQYKNLFKAEQFLGNYSILNSFRFFLKNKIYQCFFLFSIISFDKIYAKAVLLKVKQYQKNIFTLKHYLLYFILKRSIFQVYSITFFYLFKMIEQRFVMEGQVQIQLYNIQWMYNPHHNININISYNLQPDKITKAIPAKRISKQLKAQKVPDKNCDIQMKYNHKNNESVSGKNQGQKLLNEKKKSKVKKPINMQRNTITLDMLNERRIKTQGPFGQNDYFSAFKKDNKTKSHNKSVQQPVNKASHSTKKSQSFVKTNKSLKSTQNHLKSCFIPNSKKIVIEELDHNYSQIGSIAIKKRRAQSSFIRNDKVVAGLLNVSILASQLGSSQPITSERRHNDSSQSRNFKEFMSSIDMRIISKMQNDVPAFADKKQNSQRDIVRRIMGFKNISLEQLTKKVIIIQRFLKKKLKEKVVNKYKVLFKQITNKMGRSVKFNDLSDISISPQDQETNSIHNGLSLFQNQGIISADQSRKKRKGSLQSDELDIDNSKFEWFQKRRQQKQPLQKNEGLNIKKYKELVNEQVNKKVTNVKNKFIEKYKEEAHQSKKNGNQMFNFWNDKGGIDLQLINEQLVKQSKNHQFWIENDLDTFQRLQQNNGEDSSQNYVDSAQKQDLKNLNYETNKVNLLPLNSIFKNTYKPQVSQDQEQQQDLYDKNKYLSQSQQNSRQSLSQRDVSNTSNVVYPKNEFSQVGPLSVQKIIVEKPILQKTTQKIVPNYLDCELNGFGIKTKEELHQISKTSKHDFQQNQKQQNFLLDQPIGSMFEPADHFILPKDRNEEELQIYQKISRAKGNHRLIDQVVQIISSFLITQFASDISVILRRTNGPPVQKKPQPHKNQGIPTSFNSVKNYLQHFIAFIKKQEKYLQKIYQNINKDIGPTSLEILTYLRPEPEESQLPLGLQNEEETMQDQQGLFVISAQIFQQFQTEIEKQNKKQNKKQLTQKMKAFFSFWHRCIFQSFNQCLDYERPYGIQGKPYVWTSLQKKFRKIKRQKITLHLQKAQNRLLDLTLIVGGLIFQKFDSPFLDADLSEQQKHMMNEERLSRILATELIQSESSWINYNDELAQLLVELTRIIEQKIFFEHATQLKKLQRRRKMIAEQSANSQSVIFTLEQL